MKFGDKTLGKNWTNAACKLKRMLRIQSWQNGDRDDKNGHHDHDDYQDHDDDYGDDNNECVSPRSD